MTPRCSSLPDHSRQVFLSSSIAANSFLCRTSTISPVTELPTRMRVLSERSEAKDLSSQLTRNSLPLTPLSATLPRNRILAPLFATHPETPSRKSFICRTSKTPGGLSAKTRTSSTSHESAVTPLQVPLRSAGLGARMEAAFDIWPRKRSRKCLETSPPLAVSNQCERTLGSASARRRTRDSGPAEAGRLAVAPIVAQGDALASFE